MQAKTKNRKPTAKTPAKYLAPCLVAVVAVLFSLLLMALCMLSAYFPYEFMPAFWQDYIYPWNPLRYMVDGFKEILYTGAGAINGATGTVGIVALVGAVALLLNLAKKPLPERTPVRSV